MSLKFNLYLIFAFSILIGKAQSYYIWGNDTINRVDESGKKQGKWTFFNENGSPLMYCLYKDDTIASTRVFVKDGKPYLIRKPKTMFDEPFIFIIDNKEVEGYFDYILKRICFKEEQDSIYNDTVSMYIFIGLPPVYKFGKENINDFLFNYFLENKIFEENDKSSIEMNIDKNGIMTEFTINCEKKTNKIKQAEEDLSSKLKYWQPAFATWNTCPFIIKIPLSRIM